MYWTLYWLACQWLVCQWLVYHLPLANIHKCFLHYIFEPMRNSEAWNQPHSEILSVNLAGNSGSLAGSPRQADALARFSRGAPANSDVSLAVPSRESSSWPIFPNVKNKWYHLQSLQWASDFLMLTIWGHSVIAVGLKDCSPQEDWSHSPAIIKRIDTDVCV